MPIVDAILSQAAEREQDYAWLDAVGLYKKALGFTSETDFLKIGQIQEKVGYAFYRAAMQGERREEFEERMGLSSAHYKTAKEFYGKMSEAGKTSRMLRCDAMIVFEGFWLASKATEKKRLLDEGWSLAKESLKTFEEAGDCWEYGKTYNLLSKSAGFGLTLEWDFRTLETTLREIVAHGEQAIRFLSTLEDANELSRAYVMVANYQDVLCDSCLTLDEREPSFQKALSYWRKAVELNEETALVESLNTVPASRAIGGEPGTDKALIHFEKALEYGKKTKDRFVVGWAMDWLAYHTIWKASATEVPDKREELAKRALQYAEEAKRNYSPISFMSPRGGYLWVEAPHAEYYWILARHEADLQKRHDLLEKAVEAASDQLKPSMDAGYPETISHAHHVFSRALTGLAKMETNLERKKELLEKALEHRYKDNKIVEQIGPFDNWNRGAIRNFLADIKSELANLDKNPEAQKNTLQEAALDKEASLKLCTRHAEWLEKRERSVSNFVALGRWQDEYGDLLNRLYGLTKKLEHLRKAAQQFEKAAESFQRLNITSRMAECYWKTANADDALGEHLKAAKSFDLASNNFKQALEKIPQLKDFYQDHAIYMQAWSEIEKARHHHEKQEYGSAKENYEKAAGMHKSLKQWSYLAPNYSAWAQVESAEDLSRREKDEEAMLAFEQAAKLFDETKKSLQTEFSKIESMDEKQMITNLMKATDLRREYCLGRIALEEAKILDRKGDHYFSSQKYESAAQTFEQITKAVESEQDRKELKLITTISQAWQKMTRAEAEASPALYMQASRLFEEAKELSPNEKTKMLALGHSRFCRALEVGTRFADTRELTLHTPAIQHLESAAGYYTKAGFQTASEYAKATKLLFDAYVHMDNAEKEKDPEKKAKLCTMAEKVLQTSAGSFIRAEHPEKREQVLKLLEMVRGERELAVSLTEVLHAPSIVSTTGVFPTPTPSHEEAVGLEKLEHADIQANVIAHQKELKVGDNLNLEIELTNAGKGLALLIKLTEVVPKGFELKEKPEIYRAEDSNLNMKGKRLDPLKTEDVMLVLKPRVQGKFSLRPRIHYLDENGRYKSHEPEPVTITVKELGIRGWIKGES